jgi:hypothetical protein
MPARGSCNDCNNVPRIGIGRHGLALTRLSGLPARPVATDIAVVLSALLFAFSLEGLLPGRAAVRRPVPVVWLDRTREPRHRINLRAIAGLLLARAEAHAGANATADLARGSASAAGSTGWVGVFVRDG